MVLKVSWGFAVFIHCTSAIFNYRPIPLWSRPAEFSRPWHVMAEGDRGYAVIPAVYTYKLKGKLVHERGIQTFAMQKIGADWKIAGWSWSQR